MTANATTIVAHVHGQHTIFSYTKEEWKDISPLLEIVPHGVFLFENDTKKLKMADGKHTYNDLSYVPDNRLEDIVEAIELILDTEIQSVEELNIDGTKTTLCRA